MSAPDYGPVFLVALAILAIILWVRNLFLLKDVGFVLLGICVLVLAIAYELNDRWFDVDINSLATILSLFSIGFAIISPRMQHEGRGGKTMVVILLTLIALFILLKAI